jgi:hypothetical protein
MFDTGRPLAVPRYRCPIRTRWLTSRQGNRLRLLRRLASHVQRELNRADGLPDAGEVVAALPFGGELAEKALQGVVLGGISGEGEGFAAG